MDTPEQKLTIDDLRPEAYAFEEIDISCILLTDRHTGDHLLLSGQNPEPITPDQAAFLRRYRDCNRAFTEDEEAFMLEHTISPDASVIEHNIASRQTWFSKVESVLGPLSMKPTLEEMHGSLYWNACPAEVTLVSGEVNPFALLSKGLFYSPRFSEAFPTLLSDVVSVRPSPYAVPRALLEYGSEHTVEVRMGDAYFGAEAHGTIYLVDAYSDFRPSAHFFKNGDVKGSELEMTNHTINDSHIYVSPKSEPIDVLIVSGS